MKIRFVVNPISGINRNPQRLVRWIEEIFSASGEEYSIVYTRGPGDATRLAREAVEEGWEVVVAVGGDGTINELGRGLVHSDVALGVVPAGSGNGFARNFGIPLDQREAIRALLQLRTISIDAGKMNEHHFFNVAGIGLDAVISHNFEQFGVRGPLPYFVVGTKAFLTYKPEEVQIRIENKTQHYTPLLLSIANAPQYGNGAIIAPQARPDDGMLDVCILEPLPLWKAASHLHHLFNGTIQALEEYHTFRAKSLIIERPSAGPIHTDGNPHMDGKILRIETLPGALKVAVPAKPNLEGE